MDDLLECTVENHLRAGVAVVEECGWFAPTLWAERDNLRLYAIAAAPVAAECDLVERSWMLAWMADAINATMIGHTDEAWSRSYEPDALAQVKPGNDLARLAGTDPEVITALVVHATTTSTGESVCGIALPSVHDDGSRLWRVIVPAQPVGGEKTMLDSALDLLARIENDGSQRSSIQHLGKVFGTMGWTLAVHR